MEREMFYRSKVFRRSFTKEEWLQFCSQGGLAVIVTDGEFDWNVHDSCLNPHRITSEAMCSHFHEWEITTARLDGKWYVGFGYEFATSGGGSGVSAIGKSFDNETDAIVSAAKDLIQGYGNKFSQLALSELRRISTRTNKAEQLTLF